MAGGERDIVTTGAIVITANIGTDAGAKPVFFRFRAVTTW
jgi:hypothetical protein